MSFANKKAPRLALVSMLLAASLCGGAVAGISSSRVDAAPKVASSHTDRMIVKYKAGMRNLQAGNGRTAMGAPSEVVAQLAAGRGLTLAALRTNGLGADVMQLNKAAPVADLQALATAMMAADPSIEYAEPDRKMYAMLTPNDTNYSSLWGLSSTTAGVRANVAWDTTNGSGVVVAVLDTGIRPHADLAGQIVAGYDMIVDTTVSVDGDGRDGDPSDPGDFSTAGQCGAGQPADDSSWHGTHVAGTIAAVGNNAAGVIGVAYGAKVQAVRVLGRCGGYTSDIADGIIWASGGTVSGLPANATPAKVINMSLGGSGACDTTTQTAINGARSRGTSVVVAAGNSNENVSNANPANCAGVIAVAAVNPTGGRAYYSNFGSLVDVAAPGGDTRSSASNGILSTLNAGKTTPGADNYAYYQGTSMATPHVAGVAALLYAVKPSATPDQIEAALKSSARAFPATCSQCGTGIVDAPNAIAAINGSSNPPPPPPPPTGVTINETESNNSTATANAITNSNTTVNAAMGSTSDRDTFRVNLPAGKTLSATLTPPGGKDYDLYILSSTGTTLASSVKGAGLVDSATNANTGTGTVTRYVQVRYYSGGTGSYSLKVSW
jgi:serine protease